MEQKRLLLAFILSAIILFGWTYLFDPKPQQQKNSSVSADSANTSATPSPESNQDIHKSQSQVSASPANSAQRRVITVNTPLYRINFDSRGAVATSWIITHYRESNHVGRKLYSATGDIDNQHPLELIPSEDVLKNSSESILPLQLLTGEGGLDSYLASSTYTIGGIESQNEKVEIDIKPNENKVLEFLLRDEATNTEVVKSLRFKADSYIVDVGVKFTRGGKLLPNLNLAIGPSIGDQGISQYSFYAVAPEFVFDVDGDASIHTGQQISESRDLQKVQGAVNWLAISDTYFAMAAVPPSPVQGIEVRSIKYSHEIGGVKEDRYLVSTSLPIPADGSLTKLYVGPKDHDLLLEASDTLETSLNRPVDLEGLINYGWLGIIARPLATPIFWSLKSLSRMTGSYGIAIILFTIIIYSLFFPLKWRSSKAMKKAQKHAPKMKEVQEKMKGLKQTDPRLKELQMEQLKLMKEANPLGGCLPLLIQMPFIIALYTVITVSIDFRQSSFLWMPDLSAADPYRLLPILMAGSMVVLQFITPAPTADPLQRKMMAVVLPAVMLYMLWTAPAGLLVYWFVGNIVGFAQQLIINRLVKTEDDGGSQLLQESANPIK